MRCFLPASMNFIGCSMQSYQPWKHTHMNNKNGLSKFVHVCKYVHVCIEIRTCWVLHTCAHICTYGHTYMCTHMQTFIHIHTYICRCNNNNKRLPTWKRRGMGEVQEKVVGRGLKDGGKRWYNSIQLKAYKKLSGSSFEWPKSYSQSLFTATYLWPKVYMQNSIF